MEKQFLCLQGILSRTLGSRNGASKTERLQRGSIGPTDARALHPHTLAAVLPLDPASLGGDGRGTDPETQNGGGRSVDLARWRLRSVEAERRHRLLLLPRARTVGVLDRQPTKGSTRSR
jgi:hypothetical protein